MSGLRRARSDRNHRADAGEILERVVSQRLLDRRIDRKGIGDNAQCVTVGFCPGERGGRHDGPGARAVLDDDGFTPARAQSLTEDAHDHVGRAAGRERHEDRHVSRGKGLGKGLGKSLATCAERGQSRQRKAEHAGRQAHFAGPSNRFGNESFFVMAGPAPAIHVFLA
jgi:hypothetical protein